MKKILLRILEVPDGPSIDYKAVLTEVVRRPLDPQKGIGIQEMRNSIKVLDALDASNGSVELEDSEYDLLKQKLDSMPWSYADRRILQLIDDVSNA